MDQQPVVPASGGVPPGQPARLALDAPLEVANWRPLVHWLLAIPHFFILNVLGAVNGVLTFISFFAILFTKQVPRGIFDFMVMVMRYQWRVTTFSLFMREPYPPFDFESASEDNGNDIASLTVEYPGEVKRWLPLVKWLLAIPHFIVLIFLMLGGFFSVLIAFFAVLFTGKYPEGIRNYLIGVARWGLRVQAYVYLLRDEYPPFSLD
jgi:roadblock/LC7 domain-containing protein